MFIVSISQMETLRHRQVSRSPEGEEASGPIAGCSWTAVWRAAWLWQPDCLQSVWGAVTESETVATQRQVMPPTAAADVYANQAFGTQQTWQRNPLLPLPVTPKLCLVTPSPQQLPSL